MHRWGLWCSLSPATSSCMKSGCLKIWDSSLVIYCLQFHCHISFCSEVTFSPSHHCGELFPARLCAACLWSSFMVFPEACFCQAVSKHNPEVSEARNVLFCLALRCYLPSSKMQLAPSTSLSCFVWSEESSENQGRPHTKTTVCEIN